MESFRVWSTWAAVLAADAVKVENPAFQQVIPLNIPLFLSLFRNLLKGSLPRLLVHCASVAQPAERVLGKDKVASSNLA